MIEKMHMSLCDIDQTEVESIMGLIGYLDRRQHLPEGQGNEIEEIIIRGKSYRRRDIDSVSWI